MSNFHNQGGFSFGFTVHTTNESKSQSQSQNASPNKKQNKKHPKQSPRKARHQQQPENDTPTTEEDHTNNNLQFDATSVSKLFDSDHLNASSALTINDLQCATGTVMLQAFLEFPRLRRVLGIEQNKEFFHLAQQNAINLTKAGYNGRKFFVVDNIPGVKTIIAERASDEVESSKSFNKGEIVTCLHGLKRNAIDKREDYRGVINNVKKGGLLYDITMSTTKKVIQNVKREIVFKAGSERTLEFARGNLFQRKDGFRCDIVLLPFYISNDSYKSLLFQALRHAPFHSRILAYERLEDWEHFSVHSFRRIDSNVYDNDRFITNLLPFFKIYLYKHVIAPQIATPIAKLERNALKVGKYVNIRDDAMQQWVTSRIVSIDDNNTSIRVEPYRWEVPFDEEVKIESQKIHLIEHDFQVGEVVHCFCSKQIMDNKANKWNLYRCGVLEHNPDGTYVIEFEDGEIYRQQFGVWIFRPPKCAFEEGAMLMAARYDERDENDTKTDFNSLPPPRNDACIVRHRNPDGSYRIEFIYDRKHKFHDHFCESWLRPFNEQESAKIPPVLPLLLEIDYDRVPYWRPNITSHWLKRCGFEETYCNLFLSNNINGVFLLSLTFDVLTNDLNIPQNIANEMYAYIRSLRRSVGYKHEDDSAIIETIKNAINQHKLKLDKLKDIEYKANSNLKEIKTKQKQKDSQNKALRDYDIKIKCIQMSKKGASKKDISRKLGKPMNWVNKFYNKNANNFKKPQTTNVEVDNAQENVNRIRVQIQDIEGKITSEQNRLRMYSKK